MKSGHLDLSNVFRVAENIGKGLVENKKFHVVIIRSMVLPGTNEKVGKIIENYSGKKLRYRFRGCSKPGIFKRGYRHRGFL